MLRHQRSRQTASRSSVPVQGPATRQDYYLRPTLITTENEDADLFDDSGGFDSPVSPPTDDLAPSIAMALGAWKDEVDKLTPEQKDLFLDSANIRTHEEFASALEASLRGKVDTSLVIRVAKKIKPVFQLVNKIAPVALGASELTPLPSSMILGGISFILSISDRLDRYQEELLDTLDSMLGQLEIIGCYLQEGIFVDDKETHTALFTVQTDIFAFCVTVAKIFLDKHGKPKSGSLILLRSLWKDFSEQFGTLDRRYKRNIGNLQGRIQLVNSRRTRSIQKTASQLSRAVGKIGRGLRDRGISHQWELPESRRATMEEERRRLLEWLPSLPHEDDHERNSERLPGTGDWIIHHHQLLSWRSSSTSAGLWVHGKHGSGKSHLAARLIQELHGAKEISPVSFVYCSTAYPGATIKRVLGSLLKQLLAQLPPSQDFPNLRSRFKSGESPQKAELMDAVRHIAAKLPSCFIVIDGLDECSQFEPDTSDEFRSLCKFIASLLLNTTRTPGQSEGILRVAVFSRPNNKDIRGALAEFAQIQVDDGASDEDMKLFISDKIKNLSQDEPSMDDTTYLADIKTLFLNKADGMFLWVEFKAKELQESNNVEEMRECLQGVPENMDELYAQALRRILRQSTKVKTRALMALLWVTNSAQPLSKPELWEALSVKIGSRELTTDQRLRSSTQLLSECADLIIEVKGRYRLSHHSVKEFLLSPQSTLPGYRDMQDVAQTHLAEVCLTYLNFDIFKRTSPELVTTLQADYPLLEYASSFWGDHLKEARHNSIARLDILVSGFLGSENARDLVVQVWHELKARENPGEKLKNNPERKATPLHVLAMFDLTELATGLSEPNSMINEPDGFRYLPIDYAVSRGKKDMTLWLVEVYNNAGPANNPLFTLGMQRCQLGVLHHAAFRDWHMVVQLLVNLGYDKDMRLNSFKRPTPLHLAAESNSTTTLACLVELGSEIELTCADGLTPLMWAVVRGNVEAAIFLLGKQANTTVRSNDGRKLLHYASQSRSVKMATALVAHGLDMDAVWVGEQYGLTPLHIAALGGSPDMIQYLLDLGAPSGYATTEGETELHLACYSGNVRAAELLIKVAGMDMTACSLKRNQNALHLAVRLKHQDLTEFLLKECDKSTFINAADSRGNTPLHIALGVGNPEAAKMLLARGAQCDILNHGPRPPLHIAIENDDCVEVAELLLDHYGVNPNQIGHNGETALHCAARSGRISLLPRLLQASLELAIYRDAFGDTPIHEAARNDQHLFLRKLFTQIAGLELYDGTTAGGWLDDTPLHAAARGGHTQTVKFLISENPMLASQTNPLGDLPLHVASGNGHVDAVRELVTAENVNERSSDGPTALHFAAAGGHQPVIQLLLGTGADVNAEDVDGDTPAHLALINRHVSVGNVLLDRGANHNATNAAGQTLLHFAATVGNRELAERLIRLGCSVVQPDNFGNTPFFNALRKGYYDILDIFLERTGTGVLGMATKNGVTSAHLSAGLPSPRIYRRLVSGHEELAQETTARGENVLAFAVRNDRKATVDAMIRHGIDPTSSGGYMLSPLQLASWLGCTAVVRQLISIGSDVQATSPTNSIATLNRDAILWASANRNWSTVKELLRAGADPTKRDALGLSTLDYLAMETKLLTSAGSSEKRDGQDESPGRFIQIATLRCTVASVAMSVLSIGSHGLTAKDEWNRVIHVWGLSTALNLINTVTSMEYSRLCLKELVFGPKEASYWLSWYCSMCHRYPLHGTVYTCRSCIDDSLCQGCFKEYNRTVPPRAPPEHRKQLEKLEGDLLGILRILESCIQENADFLPRCFYRLSIWDAWTEAQSIKYSAWDTEHGASNIYDPQFIPGWMLIKLLEDLRKRRGSLLNILEQDDRPTLNATFSFVRNALSDIYKRYNPNREPRPFICSGHEYFEIKDEESMSQDEKAHFTDNGRLPDGFFEQLILEYETPGGDGQQPSVETAVHADPGRDSGAGEILEGILAVLAEGETSARSGTIPNACDVLNDIANTFAPYYSFLQYQNSTNDGWRAYVEREMAVLEKSWEIAHCILGQSFKQTMLSVATEREAKGKFSFANNRTV